MVRVQGLGVIQLYKITYPACPVITPTICIEAPVVGLQARPGHVYVGSSIELV